MVEIGVGTVGAMNKKFVASLDVGTTNVRCCVYDRTGSLVASSSKELHILSSERFASEFPPEHVWSTVVSVVKRCLEDSNGNIEAKDIGALGICTHRNTFLVWDRETGRPLHNFITWKDNRATAVTERLNTMFTIRAIRLIAGLLYWITRSNHFMLGKIMRFYNAMVVDRLIWLFERYPKLRDGVVDGSVVYGCLESWLLHRFSLGKVSTSVTDVSLASTTGMLDPFTVDWSYSLLRIIGVPFEALPTLRDTTYHFGDCDASLFGASIPITAIMGDQQAAAYGTGCTHRGNVMLSMGTGAFIDVNTDKHAHTSMHGLYPAIGWRLDGHVTYLAEAHCHDMATAIHWAQTIGLFDDVSETSAFASFLGDSDGVYFVPAFNGVQAPINDPNACTAFIGMTERSTRQHMVRAVLESVAFRLYQIYEVMLDEIEFDINLIRVCGGVSQNDFICATIATLCDRAVERVKYPQFSASFGVAYLAGTGVGFWKSSADVNDYVGIDRTFQPGGAAERAKLISSYVEWKKALQRTLKWYS